MLSRPLRPGHRRGGSSSRSDTFPLSAAFPIFLAVRPVHRSPRSWPAPSIATISTPATLAKHPRSVSARLHLARPVAAVAHDVRSTLRRRSVSSGPSRGIVRSLRGGTLGAPALPDKRHEDPEQ